MKKSHRFLSILMLLILAGSMIPLSQASATAESISDYSLNGNSGAVIKFTSDISSAVINDDSLAEVSASGKTLTVKGKDGAVGVASITVNGNEKVEVPIGYTTFLFDDDKVTVYNGSDDKCEVYGIKADSTEDIEVKPTEDKDGNAVYQNSGDTKLNVNIKKKGGSYVFCGKGSDMSISVNKGATADADIMLAGLDLTSSMTAPITVKKESEAAVKISALGGTTNTLTDSEFNNADTYGETTEGGDGTNAEYAESAVIKCKSNSNITLTGDGTLNLNCNTKNALKSGESGSVVIENLELNVVSAKNGLSADNTLTINSGNINVTASNGDAIRSDPDTVNAEEGSAGQIVINGGNTTLKAASDGIQSAQDVTITGGTLDITTGSGYDDKSFNKDTMSCKGIKASFDTTDGENTNTITITGGSVTLNTADDAIHSDGYVIVKGGKLDIKTGDDGIHADTSLTLGEENKGNTTPVVNVTNSYEGIEAGNVYIYSGSHKVIASDDGINSAGGAGENPGAEGFNPGGGPGGPGGRGGRKGTEPTERPNPTMPIDGSETPLELPNGETPTDMPSMPGEWGTGNGGNGGNGNSDYSLNIYGGEVYVNCEGDGLDSNGALNLEGGNITVWSQEAGRDNCPLDSDGQLYIKDATVFAAGGNAMNEVRPTSGSQNYITSTSTFTKGMIITVKDDSNTVKYSAEVLKKINFAFYSSPEVTSSYKIAEGSQSDIGTKEKYQIGDVDYDQSITSADALYVLRASVGLENTDDKMKKLADVDEDGSITSADSLDILRYSVELEVTSKVGETIEL